MQFTKARSRATADNVNKSARATAGNVNKKKVANLLPQGNWNFTDWFAILVDDHFQVVVVI
jgi:hypothetical protein